jgi:hypothetical protein
MTGMTTAGLFRTLAFVDRRGVGGHQHVQFTKPVGDGSAVAALHSRPARRRLRRQSQHVTCSHGRGVETRMETWRKPPYNPAKPPANSCGSEETLPARTSSGFSRISATESENLPSYRLFEPSFDGAGNGRRKLVQASAPRFVSWGERWS